MLESIKELFKSKQLDNAEVNSESRSELLITLGMLMLEMAGADNDFSPEEVKTCFRALDKYFDVKDSEALLLLEQAETLRKDKEKTDELLAKINHEYDEDFRTFILSLVWKIVVSDQKIDRAEVRYANQVRTRLQLSEEQGEEARKMAFSTLF